MSVPGEALTALDALDAGACVIAVNDRLARALHATHAASMLARGRTAWETSQVLPFDAFVAQQWQAARARDDTLPVLLGPAQARALWQQALADAGAGSLLSPAAAAASAASARELLLRHRAELGDEDCRDHPDAQAFAQWHARYRERLRAGPWLDAAAAGTALAEQVRAGAAPVPPGVMLAGFDRPAPQHAALLEAYAQAGARVWREAEAAPGGGAVRVACETPEAEIEAAARWARALLDAGEPGPLGVVLPDLAQRLDAVQACFEDLLHPTLSVSPRADGQRAVSVSLGRPLARVPVVADALALLELALGRAEAHSAGRVLLSGYLLGTAQERPARLALEAVLREEGVRAIRTRALAREAARSGAADLARRLQLLLDGQPRPRARRPLPEHAQRFATALGALGWPSGCALDSGEYQAVEALRGQLETLAAVGAVMSPCSAPSALALLHRLLAEALFQPRAAPAPVQIMGVLEAAGMRFSGLWLAGMSDAAWPPPESPSPLLPVALQRRHGMPGAAPAQSLERARRITARLLAAAPRVVVSHARHDGDTPLRASPLVAHLGSAEPDSLPASAQPLPDRAVQAVAPAPEPLADWLARPVGQDWRARGGSRVLTDQAACPFRAFARHRLGATGVARAPAPLDARSRGILAHRMMQALFTRLAGHADISALDVGAREAIAAAAAEVAVAAVLRRHPGEVPRRLAQAERERLAGLASRWLAVEAARAPFQVESVEQKRVVRIAGLRLDIQLDRVDRVDGARMLLDYKTGRASRAGWFGERPDEPQLPLYALALDAQGVTASPVRAVCFARLKRGEEGFEGVAEEAGWAPGLQALGSGKGAQRNYRDMAQLKAHWAQALGDLAAAFAGGDARVDPKRGACRHCDVTPLCRVVELGVQPRQDEAQDPDQDQDQ